MKAKSVLIFSFLLLANVGALFYATRINQSFGSFELLANILIVTGATIIFRGVAMSKEERDELFKIGDEDKHFYVSKEEFLLFKIELMKKLGAPQASINKKDYELQITRANPPLRFSNKKLSSLFLEAEDFAEAGTLLVVLGTVLLMFISHVSKIHEEQEKEAERVKIEQSSKKSCMANESNKIESSAKNSKDEIKKSD
ncbi:hypothetical protein [Rugamonas aquatica]|uniref:Uncharacterized protein n=1 Tax=Rugamonas aquatica TaxID=2743357 RepID=A0A6A7NAZ9_9BURK|nr:hypothetical protein [Rugamonas aquatica]MQA42138.1 hypothetical protein [Rugamonas aquatica]